MLGGFFEDAYDPYDDTTALRDKDDTNTGAHKPLRVIPKDAKDCLNLGSTYTQEGNYYEAIAEYNKALAQYPEYAMAPI